MVQNPLAGGRNPAVTVGISGDASALDNAVGTAVTRLGDLKTAVGGLGFALSAVATGALVAAVDEMRKFEDAMADVQKVTDEQTAGQVAEDIREIATEVPIAQENLAAIAEQAGKFGIEGSENIRSFVETVGQIQTATDLTAEEAGKRFAKIANATDTPISEIEGLGSAVNELADSMATDASEITDTANRAGIALSQRLGLGTDQVLSLSAAMNEVAPSSRRAAGMLRKMTSSLMDPGKVEDLSAALEMTPEAFRQLREEDPRALMDQIAMGLEGGGEQSRALAEALDKRGVEAFGQFAAAMESTDEATGRVNEQFEDATSLQEEMDIRTETLNGQLQLLRNTLSNQAQEIGEVLLPYVKDFVSGLRDLLNSSDSLLNKFSATEKAIGLVATAIGGLALGVATFVSGPLGLAIVAVAALAAAFATNFMGIRDITMEAFGAVQNTITSVIETIRPTVRNTLALLRTTWQAHGAGIIQDVQWALGQVRDTISAVLGFVVNTLVLPLLERLTRVWNRHLGGLVRDAVGAFNAVARGARQFAQLFNQLWTRWGTQIKTITTAAFGVIIGAIEFSLDLLITTIRVVLKLIQGDWRGAWELIRDLVTRTLDGIVNFLMNEGRAALKAAIDLVTGIITGAFDALKNAVIGAGSGGIIGDMISAIQAFIKAGAKEKIRMAFFALGRGIRLVVEGLLKVGGTIWKLLTGFVDAVVTYIASGQAKTDLVQAFTTLVGALEDVWKDFKKAVIGAAGIVKELISDVVTYLRTQAVEDIRNAMTAVTDGAMSAWEGFKQGLVGNSIVPDMVDDVGAEFRRMREVTASEMAALESDATARFEAVATTPAAPAGGAPGGAGGAETVQHDERVVIRGDVQVQANDAQEFGDELRSAGGRQ